MLNFFRVNFKYRRRIFSIKNDNFLCFILPLFILIITYCCFVFYEKGLKMTDLKIEKWKKLLHFYNIINNCQHSFFYSLSYFPTRKELQEKKQLYLTQNMRINFARYSSVLNHRREFFTKQIIYGGKIIYQ